MAVQVAWGITGAGHFLPETFEVMSQLVHSHQITVTTFLSSAGVQVAKMYGFWNRLEEISPGGYLQEVLTETEEGPGFAHGGRFSKDRYDALIISPATGNTVAKVAYGIADTLPTNAVAQAQKAGVPVYMVPTDQKEGWVETTLPYSIDREKCKVCNPCPAEEACPHSAFQTLDGSPKIDPTSCQGCGSCLSSCPFDAVQYGEKTKIWIRKVDAQNVNKVKSMKGITVLDHPQRIKSALKNLRENKE